MKTRRFLIPIALLLFVLNACKDNEVSPLSYSSIEQEIHDLINVHRASLGKTSLRFNAVLMQAAVDHTEYQIKNNNISHDLFQERMDPLYDALNGSKVGENVAFNQNSAQKVVASWLASAGHKANIEGDFNLAAICARQNNQGQYYFTHIFLKQK